MATAVETARIVRQATTTKDYTDFSTNGLTNTINIGNALPADAHIVAASIECDTVPAGGAIATYTVEFGDATDPNGLEAGADHIAGGVGTYDTYGAYITTAGGFANAARQLQATATSTVANLDQATQGAWTFRVSYIQF